MDGRFVPNLTFGMPLIASLRKRTKLFFDTHLMIDQPEKHLDGFISAGVDLISIHIESTQKTSEIFDRLDEVGIGKGLTLRPATPLSEVEPYLARVDLILVMTVEPGFGGQVFMKDQATKIQNLQDLRDRHGLSFLIEVDGGIKPETIAMARGADVFVVGSFVFNSANYAEAHSRLLAGLG
jgi:ribulose-phosphate 3-epimerase